MSSVQPSLEHLSLILSEVLDDIGLNDEFIQKRRTCALFTEYVGTLYEPRDKNVNINTVYMFGSQSEGTTTLGIDSDADFLYSMTGFNVINDWSNWKHGEENLLMVQDETTAPGYCILQLLRKDAPVAAEYIPDNKYCKDNKGRILMTNTWRKGLFFNCTPHGPAMMSNNQDYTYRETDTVAAFHCAQWPVEARRWLLRRNVGGWPNASLKSQCEKSGCFLAPVDSKISGLVGIEWRISTTLAERHLMYSLNNIHMKCYTMMKILLKSYDEFKDVISSYMCKTALLYCAEKTVADFWQERNLITCLVKVMDDLYYLLQVKCPHFIIPENKLMAEKISQIQQQRLLEVIEHIRREGRMFIQGIEIDHIGERLKKKLNRFHVHSPQLSSRLEIHRQVSGVMAIVSMSFLRKWHISCLFAYRNQINAVTIIKFICQFKEIHNLYPQLNNLQKKAASHILSLLCSTIGTQMACHCISLHRCITDKSIELLKFGLNSDASSGLLKLATVYYRTGNMKVTEDILTRIDQRYDRNVYLPICGCHLTIPYIGKEGFYMAANQRQVTDYRQIVSCCVNFVYNEVNIVPQELRHEFIRSTREEIQRRDKAFDRWMDLAAVDSLPYLYFLQYKVYSTSQNNEEKQRVLNKLKNVFNEEPYLCHKETVYNLLGQVMEQENLPDEAFHYYERSIRERSQHNAANIHISRLLSI